MASHIEMLDIQKAALECLLRMDKTKATEETVHMNCGKRTLSVSIRDVSSERNESRK